MTHLSDDTLNEYADAALAPALRAEADAHLAACAPCRARAEALAGLFARLDALPDEALEHDLSSAVLQALAKGVGVPRAVRWVAAAQALAAIVTLALAWPWLPVAVTSLGWAGGPVSLTELAAGLVLQWTDWMQTVARPVSLPSFSLPLPPDLNPPSVLVALTLAGACLLWLVGNGLLLFRLHAGPSQRRHS